MPIRQSGPIVLAALLLACTPQETPAPTPEPPSAMFFTITLDAVDDVEGWLYSYGLTWVPCVEPDAGTASRFSLIGTAHASHPVVYEGNGQWAWHHPLPIGAAASHLFERRLAPGKYCGLVWLFSHGGVLYEDQLGSIHLEDADGVLAHAHHASSVPIAFPEPICLDGGTHSATLRFQTAPWLARIRQASSRGTATRDAMRTFREFVEISAAPCP